MAGNRETTVVIDAGARYGMHPSWREFRAPLDYIAFEPDQEEAARLKRDAADMTVEAAALGRTEGTATLNLHRHRGCSSMLTVNAESDWFGRYRPGEGDVVGTAAVPMHTLDTYARGHGMRVDFLKIDTEGTELDVLAGGLEMLRTDVLGLRINTTFQEVYKGQALFSDLHRFLVEQGFYLLNLDYFGRGTPRNGLFRNPDPLAPDTMRYGVLIGTDGVWLKSFAAVCASRAGDARAAGLAALKYAYFCFLNYAPDVAVDTLLDARKRGLCAADSPVAASALYRSLKLHCADFLGRYKAMPDHQWAEARDAFEKIFALRLEAGSRFWEQLRELRAAL